MSELGVVFERFCDVVAETAKQLNQYKEIGTVEEFAELQNSYFTISQKLRQYEKIGTVEELREAKKKQMAEKSKHQGCFDNKGVWHEWNGTSGRPYELCPNCGVNLCCEMPYNKKPKYCSNCGQALDWSRKETEE